MLICVFTKNGLRNFEFRQSRLFPDQGKHSVRYDGHVTSPGCWLAPIYTIDSLIVFIRRSFLHLFKRPAMSGRPLNTTALQPAWGRALCLGEQAGLSIRLDRCNGPATRWAAFKREESMTDDLTQLRADMIEARQGIRNSQKEFRQVAFDLRRMLDDPSLSSTARTAAEDQLFDVLQHLKAAEQTERDIDENIASAKQLQSDENTGLVVAVVFGLIVLVVVLAMLAE